MKKILFILFVIIFSFGCSHQKDISYTDIVKTYIEKNNPESINIVIAQISKPDSAYNPFDDILDLYTNTFRTYGDISELSEKAWKANSKSQSLLHLNSAMIKYSEKHNILDSLYNILSLSAQFPEYKQNLKNEIALRVTYNVDGNDFDAYFYLDEDSVVGSSLKNMEYINKINDCLFEIAKTTARVQTDIIEIRSGKIESAVW